MPASASRSVYLDGLLSNPYVAVIPGRDVSEVRQPERVRIWRAEERVHPAEGASRRFVADGGPHARPPDDALKARFPVGTVGRSAIRPRRECPRTSGGAPKIFWSRCPPSSGIGAYDQVEYAAPVAGSDRKSVASMSNSSFRS